MCVCSHKNGFIYIYIYICVCVCVCVHKNGLYVCVVGKKKGGEREGVIYQFWSLWFCKKEVRKDKKNGKRPKYP